MGVEKSASASEISVAAAIRLVLSLGPTRIDEAAIREVLGDRSVSSLSLVAQAFGVAAATVRHTWRRDGMPGDAASQKWPLAEILIWLLKRSAANAEARGVDDFTRRKRAAETKAAEAEARIKERKAEVAEGEYVRLAVVRAYNKAVYNCVRDNISRVADQLTPMFPAKYAAPLTEETRRLLHNALTILAEMPESEYLEHLELPEEQ